MVREVAHARKRNPLSDLNKNFQGGRYPRLNHLCKVWEDRLRGLAVAWHGVRVCDINLSCVESAVKS